jgi:hypothetical protein
MSAIPEFPARDPGFPRFLWVAALLAFALALWVLVLPESGLDQPVARRAAQSGDSTEALESIGASLFIAQGCGGCHPTAGADSALGPSLAAAESRGAARIAAADYGGSAGDARTYLAESILDHCVDRLPGYECPDLPELSLRLSLDDVDALVAFLTRSFAEPAP